MSERPELVLTGSEVKGRVSINVANELVVLKAEAKSAAKAFTEAVDEQAKKARMKPGALKRYITALEADKLDDLERETQDLSKQLML